MESRTQDTVRGLSVANIILGAWLIVSPFLFYTFTATELWNSVILGIIVAVLAIIRLGLPKQSWLSLINGIAGIWLILSPFFLTFEATSAYWNTIVLGIAVAIIGFVNGSMGAEEGHSSRHRPQHSAS